MKFAVEIKKFSELSTGILSIQSAAGNKLESLIQNTLKKKFGCYTCHKPYLEQHTFPRWENAYIITQGQLPCKSSSKKYHSVDLVIVANKGNNILNRSIGIYELKTGSKFDNGKSTSIKREIEDYKLFAKEYNLNAKINVVCWDHEQFHLVSKKLRNITISGKEFCKIYDIPYNEINIIIEDYRLYKLQQFSKKDKLWNKYEDFDHFLNGQVVNAGRFPFLKNIFQI